MPPHAPASAPFRNDTWAIIVKVCPSLCWSSKVRRQLYWSRRSKRRQSVRTYEFLNELTEFQITKLFCINRNDGFLIKMFCRFWILMNNFSSIPPRHLHMSRISYIYGCAVTGDREEESTWSTLINYLFILCPFFKIAGCAIYSLSVV